MYHSCSDAGIHDCAVVQELLKEVAQSHTLDPTGQKDFKGTTLTILYCIHLDLVIATRKTFELTNLYK